MAARTAKRRSTMSDRVYAVTELVGSSSQGIDDAIRTALRTASKTVRNMNWFEVVDI
ncbi:MAG: dodecin family protein, partial [Alphaproteobacteria bacterium]